jgi:rare lipoprotein A
VRIVAIVLAVLAPGGIDPGGPAGAAQAAPALAGVASWYGSAFEGRAMANGCPFHRHALSAASRVLPLGERVRVRLRGKSVIVPVTDRGPYISGRVIDLSEAAAARLGMIRSGLARVEIDRLGGPVTPSCRH